MAVSHRFSDNIALLEFSGSYTIEDMKTAIIRSLDDSACPENVVMLLDMRLDEAVQERSPREIRDMSYFFGEIRDRIHRRLCMVTSDNLAFGLMNMAKAYDQSMGIDCRTFTDMDKAMAWLNTSDKEADSVSD
jgi:hypothetical protein